MWSPAPIVVAAAVWLLCAGDAPAQLRALPELPLPPPELRAPPLALPDARRLRLDALNERLRRHADVLDADPAGAPIVRSEVAALAPTDAALAAARGAGFTIARERVLDGLDMRLVVLRAPPGLGTAQALDLLRRLDPQGSYDFNHLYAGSGIGSGSDAAAPVAAGTWRVGLIDSGVDATHATLRGVALQRHGCATDRPDAHGTAVASLLAAHASGTLRGIFAADVFCGRATGGAADALLDAFAWMARERVAVVNVSLVGPPNQLLERMVSSLTSRGHLVVAAVGNDGPNAAPLYPAAYPGVVGVTAVDARSRVLPEALRGGQVAFAAPGADIAVARPRGGRATQRGTSYAAPVVAALLARRHAAPDTESAAAAITALARSAIDLGAPGRDPVYGHGLVGAAPNLAGAPR